MPANTSCIRVTASEPKLDARRAVVHLRAPRPAKPRGAGSTAAAAARRCGGGATLRVALWQEAAQRPTAE